MLMAHETLSMIRQFLSYGREQWEPAEKIQAGRLQCLLESARKTEYYGAAIPPSASDNGIWPIKPTDKEDVISNPERFLSAPKSSLRPAKTSGSTGSYAIVYLDSATLIQRTAFRLFIESQFGRSPLDLAVQIHGSCPKPSALSKFGIFRKKFLSVFDKDEDNFRELYASGANVFGSYTSALSVMARYNNRLEKPLRMKLVFSYGEVLTQEARRFVEESFSCPLFQLYGSTEFGPIAFECPEERKLHVNSGAFLVELVDSKNRPSASGEILVTSLVNRSMPLLRYRIGDRAAWGRCGCGRSWPVLESIEGRTDDFAVLPSGKLRSAFSFFGPYAAPNLKGYQIVQETPGLFVFKYEAWPPGITESSRKNIIKHLKTATLGEDVHFELQEVESLPKESTGKLRHFISRVKK